MNAIRKSALINAASTALYVIAVASFMYWGSTIKLGRVNSFLAPMAFLLLFVFSAAFTGFLFFGKPAQMYVDGKKKEALRMLSETFVFFFLFTLLALILLIFYTR